MNEIQSDKSKKHYLKNYKLDAVAWLMSILPFPILP